MTADEKLKALAAGIAAAELGSTKVIHCPYCHTDLDFSPPSALAEDWQPPRREKRVIAEIQNRAGGSVVVDLPTCCADFGLAAIAILQRKEQHELKDLADRIGNNVGGMAVFN